MGRAGSLYGVRVGVYPGVRQEDGLGGLPTPLVVLSAGGVLSALLLLLALQKWQLGFWSFCILLSIICPNYACTQLFLVPYIFFVFCCWGDICPGASTAAKGPRCQLVYCTSYWMFEDTDLASVLFWIPQFFIPIHLIYKLFFGHVPLPSVSGIVNYSQFCSLCFISSEEISATSVV